ncbi:MAG: lipopolysaccharide assembly protein LapB [Betaproteobacteria bacterium]|nr:lipopolysaccharide assembly protein LapB [Betaproteobacteria bacterium]
MSEWLPWLFVGALAFFGIGWLVARIDIKQLLLESRAMPQAYFKGLNFLLNEQQDKAIEAFIEVTKAHPEAVELQFALGSLFRRRGEVDRAIRVHQELSERDGLGAEQRTDALLELALDYQKAGLLDHAQRILGDLATNASGTEAQQTLTLQRLLDIHVQERDWAKAVDAATRLDKRDAGADTSRQRQIAHYHCELATQAKKQGRDADAFANLDEALAANPQCVRANLMRGEWLAAAGKHAEAIAAWRAIEQQDPAFLGLMGGRMLTSYVAIGQTREGQQELARMQQQYPALDLLNALFQITLESEGADVAFALVQDDLRRNPTLVGLDRLLEARLLSVEQDRKADLQVIKDLVHAHSSRLAVYLCGNCGFKAKQYYWQCPACNGWETFPPRQTAEYDTADRHLVHSKMQEQQLEGQPRA